MYENKQASCCYSFKTFFFPFFFVVAIAAKTISVMVNDVMNVMLEG
jgi:hypothetical protein